MSHHRKPSKKRPTRRRRRPTLADWKRWERSMFRQSWRLEAYYRGYDREIDRAIERAVRKSAEGSGMMVMTGLRDLGFELRSERAALAAARRIQAVPRLHRAKVRCMIRGAWLVKKKGRA